uniref:Peroxisomal membrane protein 11C n=1 Tax=Arion vulgaris TaxID=1028688 RepID=A0A0B6YTQ2_9EUPU
MSLSKNLIKFNTQTAARDKIFRLAQYGSRLILWQLTHGSSEVKGEIISRLTKLEGALGLSRKLFRLGNCVDLAYKAIDALSISHPGIRALMVTSQTMKALWLFIDHFLWFGKIGAIKIDLVLWTRWSLRAWLVCLATASLADIIQILHTQNKLRQHRKENWQNTTVPSNLQIQIRTLRMNFWRDVCDLFLPLGGLGYTNPGLSALCGVISSLIGFQQEWERHIKPFQPKT